MKKYFIAGMLVWAPLAITIWVMTWGLSVLDGVFGSVMSALMAILPSALKPALQSFRDLPGVGILIVSCALTNKGKQSNKAKTYFILVVISISKKYF